MILHTKRAHELILPEHHRIFELYLALEAIIMWLILLLLKEIISFGILPCLFDLIVKYEVLYSLSTGIKNSYIISLIEYSLLELIIKDDIRMT